MTPCTDFVHGESFPHCAACGEHGDTHKQRPPASPSQATPAPREGWAEYRVGEEDPWLSVWARRADAEKARENGAEIFLVREVLPVTTGLASPSSPVPALDREDLRIMDESLAWAQKEFGAFTATQDPCCEPNRTMGAWRRISAFVRASLGDPGGNTGEKGDQDLAGLRPLMREAVDAWKEWDEDSDVNFPSERWLNAMASIEDALNGERSDPTNPNPLKDVPASGGAE